MPTVSAAMAAEEGGRRRGSTTTRPPDDGGIDDGGRANADTAIAIVWDRRDLLAHCLRGDGRGGGGEAERVDDDIVLAQREERVAPPCHRHLAKKVIGTHHVAT